MSARDDPWWLLEAAPVGSATLDGDGRIVFANRRLAEMFGYEAAALVGLPLTQLVPNASRTVAALIDRTAAAAADAELVGRRRDGSEIPIELAANLLPEGVGARVIATICDASSHARVATLLRRSRESEALFRGLLEAAPDAVLVVGADGRIELANDQAERMFGHPREHLIGAPLEVLIPETERSRHGEHMRSYFASPRRRPMAASTQLRARLADGRELPVEVALSPAPSELGAKVIAAIRDVSDRARVEAQLMASERLSSMGTLAAGVVHEINNPLVAVITNLDLALAEIEPLAAAGRIDTAVRDEIVDARDASDRVRRIVRDLRVFARVEDDVHEPVGLHTVLDASLRIAANEIRHRARLVRDYGEVPAVVANEARLGQVFLNLLVNAAQSIPEGRADANEIRVTTRTIDATTAVVEITDTGGGMSAEVQRQAFVPFFTTKAAGAGTGLGLAICARLVAGFGGRLELHSDVGRGTTVRVRLPTAVAAPVTTAAPALTPEMPPVRRGRVLVIDDEPLIATAVGRILAGRHDVTICTTAAQALALLDAGDRFDVIFCDVMMPVMTGGEFFARLRASSPAMAERVVFMTGGAFTSAAHEFLDTVGNQYVEKPFGPEMLRALVDARVR